MPHPDRSTLDACLDDMRKASKDNAPISNLNYRPGFGSRVFCDRLVLDRDKGIIGDRWFEHAWIKTENGDPDPRLQVSIINTRLLNLIWENGDGNIYPGDNIAADIDLSAENLPIGARLQVGSAVIEVGDVYNDGCVKWKARYGRDAYDWARDPALMKFNPRGIFCKIVQSGEVSISDRLVKL